MDRERLADAARKRRLTLGRRMKDVARIAGISHATVRAVERGDPVKAWNLWKLDLGLDWEPGSAERILDGEPAEVQTGIGRMTRGQALDAIREALAGQDPQSVERIVADADRLPDAELFEMTARIVLNAYRNRRVQESPGNSP